MSWVWRYENADGVQLVDDSLGHFTFPAQADAETWIGENWQDLLSQGVDAVVLMEGDRVVYGPMSLHPPQ
jgi:hypothetical protein